MIGWYAHHHGSGHITRARAVMAHLHTDTALVSSHPDADVVLPLDVGVPRTAACAADPGPRNLHYAPLGVLAVRERMLALAEWVGRADPALVVVDVSAEVAMQLRLLSVPTVVVRQHGRREDEAHLTCYGNATALLAPYPVELEQPDLPGWVRDKTVHVGGFSRFDGRPRDREGARDRLGIAADERLVVVLSGTGGRCGWPVAEAVRATPGWTWAWLGHPRGAGRHEWPGWVDDPWDWLCAADVLVTHGGHNAVMECAAAGRPTIVVPVDRPFDEQGEKARRLEAAGLGQVHLRWPEATRWPSLLEDATTADRTLAPLVDGRGATRAADALHHLARRLVESRRLLGAVS